MKHEGRGVIRRNDKTDHGGIVISASSGTTVIGIVAALDGDMTVCGGQVISDTSIGSCFAISRS